MNRHNLYGFTLIEMLMVLSIMSILIALGAFQVRPPSALLLAKSLKAQLVQARLEAIKRNRPVSVLWNNTTMSFTTLTMSNEDSTVLPCSTTGTTTLNSQRVSEYPRAQASNVFTSSVTANAVVWYPNGLPRFCNGANLPTTNSTVRLSDVRHTLYIRVSPAGRVEVARAP